jgi:uncharacterized protein (TIGR03437 family)
LVAGASVAQNAQDVMPLLWNGSTPQSLPVLTGFSNAIATSVNDSGVAAGLAFSIDFSLTANGSSHAVLFNNGAVTDLGLLPGGVSSAALGINNSGDVVGFNSSQPPTFALQLAAYFGGSSGTTYTAFIYSGGKMYNLNSQLTNGTGWQLSFANQINNAGQIVGTGLINGNQHAFLLTPVPAAPAPSITSVVGAGFSTPAVTNISPNGIFTIFGSKMATGPRGLLGSDIVNGELPTNLIGTCVESGSTKWGLFYVSAGQINVVAGDLPASGTAPVTIVTGCGTDNEVSSPVMNVPVDTVSPEFLYFLTTTNGQNPIAAIDAVSGAYIGAPGLITGANFTPAKADEVLTAFGVGWGATTPANTPGAVDTVAAKLSSSNSLTLGGVPITPSYIGLSPSFAGLYQVNFKVPSGLTAGSQPLVLTVDGVKTSATAFITVGN